MSRKAKQTIYRRAWREKNRARDNANAKVRQAKHRAATMAVVRKIKESPCADCGGQFPICCMDFDHRPGEVKVAAVSRMFGTAFSLAMVLAEIAKCDLVCANCHRIRTDTRQQYRQRQTPSDAQTSLPIEAAS